MDVERRLDQLGLTLPAGRECRPLVEGGGYKPRPEFRGRGGVLDVGCRSERDRQVLPLFGVGTIAKELSDPVDDGGELAVVERPDQDAAGMVPVSFGPLSQQRGEVPRVSGHENASLLGRKFENLRIVPSPQRDVGRQAQYVVTTLLKGGADSFG